MQAVILAAGFGSRLKDRGRRPKPLVDVGGRPMVEHQLAMLAAAGVSDVLVVVGHAQDRIRSYLGDRVRYVVNDAYASTNSLYSFLRASRHVREDTLVLNCDVLCHPRLMQQLADAPGDALLYDARSGDEAEHMKVAVHGNRLVDMSKELPPHEVCGENVGLLKMRRDTVARVAQAGRAILREGGRRAWLAQAVREVARSTPFQCLDVAGLPWVEIDFPEDLAHARAVVHPAVSPALERLDTDLELRNRA